MAKFELTFGSKTKNLDQAITNVSALANKLDRMSHLFGEIKVMIIDLENDLNNIEVSFIEKKGTDNGSANLAGQKEIPSS